MKRVYVMARDFRAYKIFKDSNNTRKIMFSYLDSYGRLRGLRECFILRLEGWQDNSAYNAEFLSFLISQSGVKIFNSLHAVRAELEKVETKENDPTNPDHYKVGGIQPYEIMKAKMTSEQYEGFLLGNVIKYILRYQHKNGKEDLEKARWYLNEMLSTMEEADET